jgi:arylsulfatase A-like enzyme
MNESFFRSGFPPALLVALTTMVFLQGCGRSGKPPNVLLITLDTTRADRLGCYGYPAGLTPNIDGVADRGVLFERAYSTVPLTLPSHSSMMTGLYPPEHGVRVNGANALSEDVGTLAEVMSNSNYRTGAFIAAFVLDRKFGLGQGFEEYNDNMIGAEETGEELHQYRNGRVVVDAAMKWLKDLNGDRFFAWVHLYDPHRPYHAHRDRFGDKFEGRTYEAEIAFADMQVGLLLDFLRNEELADNTLVAIVGDHGEGLGDHNEQTHGFMVYGTTMRIPMILSLPGKLPEKTRIKRPVSIVNLGPTLADIAGVRLREPLGVAPSLVPAWTGGELENPVYYSETEAPWNEHKWCPLRAVTTEEWKYIKSERPELYRWSEDPDELDNLVETMPEQVREMESLLLYTEKQMIISEGANVHLSDEDRRVLEGLGYLSGGGKKDPVSDEELPDVKDRIELINRNARAKQLRKKNPDEAIELLRKTVAEEPDDYLFQRELANNLFTLQRYEDAIKEYDRLIVIAPQYVGSYNRKGLAFFNLGRTEEAIKAYEKAIEMDANYVDPRANLSVLYANEGEIDLALETILPALKTRPDSADLHKNVALIYEKKAFPRKAEEHWKRVLEINPLFPDAFERIQDLQRRNPGGP